MEVNVADAAKGAVLITGASSGMGKACALYLDDRGFRVFAGVRKEKDAEALRLAASSRLTPILMDVADPASIAAAADTVARAVGETGLAGLVNNAGVAFPGPLEYLPLADLRMQMEVNVIGQVAVTQAFLPLIRKARGRIINVGSVGGKITMPFGGALCGSKYAMEAVTDALRMELHPWGIHVVMIAPAEIATPAVDKLQADADALVARMPAAGKQRYGGTFTTFVKTAAAREKAGSPPEVMAEAALHALTAPVPRVRYPMGRSSRLLPLLSRTLPARLLDRLRFKIFGLPDRFGVWE